mmetsp:Transcript_39258/g.92425  ORF Transcript_39258/g.92425 Transcript_39258/m.92425 type:complete len:127 (+) Transcript_39258:72-452(+)|eukprot:CAMPEP_0178429684 /NCGR_PEP_ID=MMETSP0689_2-20121128/30928_1 /TAXON_ID=160604 /ORGANISM="Amphidinium massartii, Strain CS-259" /LENGTH=126 /DNA_ID=CAMNT_0020051511 /DNA_START=64 /DNA_END=444 /DNA_ORIENTATION=+
MGSGASQDGSKPKCIAKLVKKFGGSKRHQDPPKSEADSKPSNKENMAEDAEAQALRQQEESLSAGPDFKGKGRNGLSAQERRVLHNGATDQKAGPYAGKKFLPKHGYFACKQCGIPLFAAQAKFVH